MAQALLCVILVTIAVFAGQHECADDLTITTPEQLEQFQTHQLGADATTVTIKSTAHADMSTLAESIDPLSKVRVLHVSVAMPAELDAQFLQLLTHAPALEILSITVPPMSANQYEQIADSQEVPLTWRMERHFPSLFFYRNAVAKKYFKPPVEPPVVALE